MEIRKIFIYRLNVPFIRPISHNLAERHKTESVIVAVEDNQGLRGYGEGAPRVYVTGETVESVIRSVSAFSRDLVVQGLPGGDVLASLREAGRSAAARKNPSAWCALELALLDLYATRQGVPLWRLFSESPFRKKFIYSAVLPLTSDEGLESFLNVISEHKMEFVKVKIARGNGNLSRLERLRNRLGANANVRVDANAAFSSVEALDFIDDAFSVDLSAFEQPVSKDDLKGMEEVTRAGKVRVVADESLCSVKDAQNLIERRACDAFNVRLSKCGGFLTSLSIYERARVGGISCQLGCHIGETGILAAAGRHFAALCPDLMYLEGSFSKYLLREDVVKNDISFGPMGEAPLLYEPGLGVRVDDTRLEKWGNLEAEIA